MKRFEGMARELEESDQEGEERDEPQGRSHGCSLRCERDHVYFSEVRAVVKGIGRMNVRRIRLTGHSVNARVFGYGTPPDCRWV
jgi:hypothetical protein